MNTYRNMQVFVGVVKANGFSAASKNLGVSPTEISRAISTLERHLNARLLNRTAWDIARPEHTR